jgi:hypothetical protein
MCFDAPTAVESYGSLVKAVAASFSLYSITDSIAPNVSLG